MNITNISIENIGDFINVVNQETYGSFGITVILSMFLIGYILINRKYETPVSLFLSSILTFPIFITFYLLDLFNNASLIIYLLGMSALGVLAFLKRW